MFNSLLSSAADCRVSDYIEKFQKTFARGSNPISLGLNIN